MKCKKHPKRNAKATCVGCGNFFCDDCLTSIKGKNYCKDCTSDLLAEREHAADREKTTQPQIVIHQQQQQSQQQTGGSKDEGKPRGSYFWLCFWIVVFFPIAIIYFLMRRWD